MAIFTLTDQPIALPLAPPLPHTNNATDIARTDVAANSQKGFFVDPNTDWDFLAVKLRFLLVGMVAKVIIMLSHSLENFLQFCTQCSSSYVRVV